MATFVGKCKRCKVAARFDAERVERVLGIDRWGAKIRKVRYVAPWCGEGRTEEPNNDGSLSVQCLCGGRASFSPLRGRVSGHKCNAKCLASTSGVCECACGGRNHGASHC
jgi:hypothetical protein